MSKYLRKIFFNHTPLFLAKESYNSNQNVNDQIVKHIKWCIDWILKNPNKIVDIIKKQQKQQKGKGLPSDLALVACVAKVSDHSNLKILTCKQMLQRLPIALVQV